jgi:predicted RNA-binding Zn-ribbon protein involved in translation (DUF1610 family)
MSIDRQYGKIVIECSSCDATIESEQDEDWDVFWPRAVLEGWKSRKVGHDWVHGCPDCGV